MSASESAAKVDQHARSIIGGQSKAMRGRYFRDSIARYVVFAGGLGVIGALLLIFVYLVSEVAPLFGGAEVHPRQAFSLPAPTAEKTLLIGSEDRASMGVQVTDAGGVYYFNLFDGSVIDTFELPMDGQQVVAFTESSRARKEFVAQRQDGQFILAKNIFKESFDQNQQRVLTPTVEYPFGDAPLAFTEEPMRFIAARSNSDALLIAGVGSLGEVVLKRFSVRTSLLGGSSIEEGDLITVSSPFAADRVYIDNRLMWLYVINDDGRIALMSLRGERPTLVNELTASAPIRHSALLGGDLSLVLAQADGKVSQWFPARDAEGNAQMAAVRTLDAFNGDVITALAPELYRRTLAVGAADGTVALMHATANRRVWRGKVLDEPVEQMFFNPRSQYLIAVGASGQARGFDVENEHPEVSFSAMWQKVWYEGYDGPTFNWQSSAAINEFEPKFSLAPLAFGTLKAAFYAMLFAIPLAILGAIFTANFMSSQMRQAVKPTIELMEALPTVILGFLAGLWLAPFIETNLLGVFLVLLLLPLSIPLFGYVWLRMPKSLRQRTPAGWEAALLIPIVAVVVWLCFAVAKPLEAMLFTGTMQQWMDSSLGIAYDQRNALVVGIAMGIAVVPTIYSITEDAIFSVPKQLSLGSLALGATPWQTLTGVVLLTASPGIFSAVMIGVGRAVGETMIVLMATGNTAVMDASMFQGLRTMSANIAVEVPESEVGGTHYRLLFLSGLVLFIFTFFFNTLAEIVRQRLRQKYASI